MAAEDTDEQARRLADAAGGAVFGNGFRPTEPWVDSTAFRACAVRHAAVRSAAVARPAEEFLVNSRLRRRDAEFEASVGAYFTEPSALMTALLGLEGRQGSRAVALPGSVPLEMALAEAVRRRRSTRAYTGDAIGLRHLATLLRTACGVTARIGGDGSGGPELALRSVPSGGGLYPIALHVIALRVDGLGRGAYVHDPRGERLWQTGDADVADAAMAAVAAPDETIATSLASAAVLSIARPWRAMRKYGDRGMRHVFLEAGMISEQLHLAAAALGLGSVDCGSFYDDEVHEALELDGVYEALVHATVIGVPA